MSDLWDNNEVKIALSDYFRPKEDRKMRERIRGKRNLRIGAARGSIDRLELVIITAVMALLAALGIMLFFAVLTGADIYVWNRTAAVTIYFLLTGVIWAILIIKNC